MPSLGDARLSYAMVMPLMGNNCIAAAHVDGKATRARLPMPIQKLTARRFCMPLKNAAVYAASHARIAHFSHDRLMVEQKK